MCFNGDQGSLKIVEGTVVVFLALFYALGLEVGCGMVCSKFVCLSNGFIGEAYSCLNLGHEDGSWVKLSTKEWNDGGDTDDRVFSYATNFVDSRINICI